MSDKLKTTMIGMGLRILSEQISAIAKVKKWWDEMEPKCEDDRCNAVWLIHDEVQEAYLAAENYPSPDKDLELDNLDVELADIVIQAFSTAGFLGVDLRAAILQKLDVIRRRENV